MSECSHPSQGRWEVNPQTLVYTRRCGRCGGVLEHMTEAEAARATADNRTGAPLKEIR